MWDKMHHVHSTVRLRINHVGLLRGNNQRCSQKGWFPPKEYLLGGWATPLKNMKVNWDD